MVVSILITMPMWMGTVEKIMGFTIPSAIRLRKPMPVYQERMYRMPYHTI